MIPILLLLLLVLLLLLNAFYVLAEFAAVKVRGTQVAALGGKTRDARLLAHVHEHLDEYLSVCQLGITLASVGLGFVGEPALAMLIEPVLHSHTGAHAIALTASYIVVSALHIVVGELVPKTLAISFPLRCALLVARPLRWSHWLLFIPLKLLNGCARLLVRPFGIRAVPQDAAPSEAEVRIILEESQQQGLMPFRRLLLVENVFDFGHLHVRDEMRPLNQVSALHADHPWAETLATVTATKHTRYPVLEGTPPRPIGIVHIKDLLHNSAWPGAVDLRAIARKTHVTTPDAPLEQLLTELRRRRNHMAIVQDPQGQVCGLITMEDILEQLVGDIEDEFEQEAPLRIGEALKESRVFLDLAATTAAKAIDEIVRRSDTNELPLTKDQILEAVLARERSLSTYLGHGLAVPHARLDNLKAPYVCFARSEAGVVFDPQKPDDRAHGIFLLLTPQAVPRSQIRLLARIANLRESEYVWDRLLQSGTPGEALDAIRSGEELLTT